MILALKTVDKNFRALQQQFQRSRKVEADYARKLRSIAHQVGIIVQGMAPEGFIKDYNTLAKALQDYSGVITPWARAVASRMLAELARRDEAMWIEVGNSMGRNLRQEIQTTPIGTTLRAALEEQVGLITSLPLEAALRVQRLSAQMLTTGARSKELAQEIMNTGHVTKSRATLIARTEISRTATELTKTRSLSIDLPNYIWRTAGDHDVRLSHQHMNGKIIAWANPPVVEVGKPPYHAGQIYNCRCYPEPIIPEMENHI